MANDELTMLDVGAIEEELKLISNAITENRADRISDFFRDLLIRIRVNERKLDEYKRFIPIIYPQANNSSDVANDGIFRINLGAYTTLTQALIMMIPKESSIGVDGDSTINKLQLYKNNEMIKSFDIYKEGNSGSTVKITNGDIVPGRTVLFRLVYAQFVTPKAIIINTSGLFNESVSNLHVTGTATFGSKPTIFDPLSVNQEDYLVAKSELDVLDRKIDGANGRFIITREDARTVADSVTTPDGAIVVQIEDD